MFIYFFLFFFSFLSMTVEFFLMLWSFYGKYLSDSDSWVFLNARWRNAAFFFGVILFLGFLVTPLTSLEPVYIYSSVHPWRAQNENCDNRQITNMHRDKKVVFYSRTALLVFESSEQEVVFSFQLHRNFIGEKMIHYSDYSHTNLSNNEIYFFANAHITNW